jgi:hypothetical protein
MNEPSTFLLLQHRAVARYIAISAEHTTNGWLLDVDCGVGIPDDGVRVRTNFKNRPELDVYLTALVQNFKSVGYLEVNNSQIVKISPYKN